MDFLLNSVQAFIGRPSHVLYLKKVYRLKACTDLTKKKRLECADFSSFFFKCPSRVHTVSLNSVFFLKLLFYFQ